MTTDVDRAVAALLAGHPVVLPTDTVYGLAAIPTPAATARLYALKGRGAEQPMALVASTVDLLLECVPELADHSEAAVRALLPGPFTLVVPNPSERYPWICGNSPQAIGVRVPALRGVAQSLLERMRVVVATSANLPSGTDPRSVAEVPLELRTAVAAVLDAGPLPGVPSTVVDVTGTMPRVLREGAVAKTEALARLQPTPDG